MKSYRKSVMTSKSNGESESGEGESGRKRGENGGGVMTEKRNIEA